VHTDQTAWQFVVFTLLGVTALALGIALRTDYQSWLTSYTTWAKSIYDSPRYQDPARPLARFARRTDTEHLRHRFERAATLCIVLSSCLLIAELVILAANRIS
jgi:hypothetical protein